MIYRFSLTLTLIALLAACAPAAPDDRAVDSEGNANLPGAGGSVNAPKGSLGGVELCDAETYRPQIGQTYTSVTVPQGPKLRIYSSTAVVTQEYLPDRTNVVYDDRTGKILRAFCG